MEIDKLIDSSIEPIANAVASVIFYSVQLFDLEIKFILFWLVIAAIFFTFYLGFINVRYFTHAIDVLRGKFDTDGCNCGEISRFQALMTSLSATIGLGNIAGVAVAISLGGPGAAFWMAVMGIFSMSTKFVEVTLGIKYRQYALDDNCKVISGGPMHYLRAAFEQLHYPRMGKFMAGLFAICCIGGTIGAGGLFQANQAYQQAVVVTGGDASFLADKGWLFGLFMAALVGLVIIGGIQWIAAVAGRIVPIMTILYIIAGIVVMGVHYQAIPEPLKRFLKWRCIRKLGSVHCWAHY